MLTANETRITQLTTHGVYACFAARSAIHKLFLFYFVSYSSYWNIFKIQVDGDIQMYWVS
jgi:hypothetical protein